MSASQSAPTPADDGGSADVVVVGAGPAGLAAAEAAAGAGARVLVLERLARPGRKLLMAGKSGLNLTHAEPYDRFRAAYPDAAPALLAALDAHPPAALGAWAEGLGQPLFTGSTGRVFPVAMKASPLLRAHLARLAGLGAELRTRARLVGLTPAARGWRLAIETPTGAAALTARAVVLALGGASWARLGSDGAWTALADALGAPTRPFAPSNGGWRAAWSAPFVARFAGAPVKATALFLSGEPAAAAARGEWTVSADGLEGHGVYQIGPRLRAAADAGRIGDLRVDLAPDRSESALRAALARPRGKASASTWLRKAARLTPVKIGLLREGGPPPADPAALAARIKAAPIPLIGPGPMDAAISTAGGLAFDGLTADLMLRCAPGVFAAGEMLDWDAPTGGYLLTAAYATGRRAGAAAAAYTASTTS